MLLLPLQAAFTTLIVLTPGAPNLDAILMAIENLLTLLAWLEAFDNAERQVETVSGVLVVKDGKGIIGVNANHHPNRQRFTVAHELGHFLLHRDDGRIFVDRSPVFFRDAGSSEGTSRQEIEANAFAAALLMPEADLKSLLDDRPVDAFDETSVRRLAARLGVSAQALTIRLTRLGLVSEF